MRAGVRSAVTRSPSVNGQRRPVAEDHRAGIVLVVHPLIRPLVDLDSRAPRRAYDDEARVVVDFSDLAVAWSFTQERSFHLRQGYAPTASVKRAQWARSTARLRTDPIRLLTTVREPDSPRRRSSRVFDG